MDRLEPAAAAAANRLLSAVRSKATELSYQSAEAYWQAWYRARYGDELSIPLTSPVDEDRIVQFVLDHVAVPRLHDPMLPASIDQRLVDAGVKARIGPLSLATVRHRISVLSRLHARFGNLNPCRSALVFQLLRGVGAALADAQVSRRFAPAIKRDVLDALLSTCDDSPIGVRDRALLLFAWLSGGRRRSEAANATVENTARQLDGTYQFTLLRSKTNAQGVKGPETFTVESEAATALATWIATSGIRTGPLFCWIRREGRIVWVDEGAGRAAAMSPAAINDMVKRRALKAGLAGASAYSAHSLRSGYVTQALLDGTPIDQAMQRTGHTSISMFLHYNRRYTATPKKSAESDSPKA